jgi:6-pyruvoyltetrahydropterin/6-carboxytetrahydropterin synthase
MNIISKEIRIDYGHRVARHQNAEGGPGKCSSCHGHSGVIIAEMVGELFGSGPQTEMVLDYGILKNLMMTHIDAMCDHAMIISLQDAKYVGLAYEESLPSAKGIIFSDWVNKITETVRQHSFWSGKTAFGKTYIINEFPTAESLAEHFFYILAPQILEATNKQAYLTGVTFKETPTSVAIYRP